MTFPKDADFLFVDHFDQGLYREALQWVGEGKRAAFISDTKKKSDDPRIRIYHLESPLQREMLVKKIAWSAVFQKVHVIGDDLQELFEKMHLAAHLILSDAAGYFVKPLENAMRNAGPFRRGLELEGAFQNIPAVIVGAGPSLEKNGHIIRELKDKALIFAGGSALDLLDVEPHFGGAVDAEAPVREALFKNVPFCYQARMNVANLSLMQGERILFPDSSLSAINWLYGEEDLFDGGWTVGNFLTQVAILMGCSPIIFVGMDFCYQGDRKYARMEAEMAPDVIEVEGYLTQRDWWMALMWTREKALGRDFINASEGGMLGLKRQSLAHLANLLPKRELSVEKTLKSLSVCHSNRIDDWRASIALASKDMGLLEGEAVYEKLLKPLWQIWKPIFEREVELDAGQDIEMHKQVFFQNVLREHGSVDVHQKRYFYEDGTLRTLERYQNGSLSGESTLFWPNGKIKRQCFFTQGVRDGVDRFFSDEGVLLDEGNYSLGKPIGVHSRYNKKGVLIEEVTYLDESRFNLRSWDDRGNLSVEALWIDPLHYRERVWDRFQMKWIEKRGHFDGKRLVYVQ